ncbi:Hpt domain-containing protein [Paenibacillus hexagrammi]|uniref:Hpt domain-containing protein n=1 Tax=Paenibacillus hexagrammi TaxID=2908839 RepID=A0ABY3SC54_9BACL|nr:Hpt domain-containing protein [Paenibacillus sp. YPD9-1]UJF31367.1 Hpt domain-containing protein [Paenibacillus sp. YPD9-1]
MSDYDMSEYLAVFLSDMEEHLYLFEDALLQMEKHGADTERITVIFRAAHSLKGSSAAMGFDQVTQLTHRMEDILDRIRSDQLTIDAQVIHILFTNLDLLTHMKDTIQKNESLNQVPTDENYSSNGSTIKSKCTREHH